MKFIKILLSAIGIHMLISGIETIAILRTLDLFIITLFSILTSLFCFIPLTFIICLRLLLLKKIKDNTLRAAGTIGIGCIFAFDNLPMIGAVIWVAFYSHYLDVKNG